jgi:DNA-binding CsgD family transcriptional regulator
MTNQTDLNLLGAVLDVVLESDSLNDICRRAVLSSASNNTFRGCHIQSLNQAGQLEADAHYGVDLPENYRATAEDALYSRELKFTPETPTTAAMIALPLLSGDLPAAVAILVLKPGANRQYIGDEIVPLIGKLVGHHLIQLKATGKAKGIQTFSGTRSVADMSTRQLKILEFMAEGLTNAEIARKLLLSESTVRQESVKIYRTFNTDNRQMAVAFGREAGIIAKLDMAS